jgi:tRNA pseudouridine(55) synthase
MATPSPYHAAIYALYKPQGISSYDCLRSLVKNKIFSKEERIGHIGTLDVFADGVLLISQGHATRLNDYVHELLPKTYLATGKLGMATNTGDLTGEVTSEDHSQYLYESIFKYDVSFLNQQICPHFVGEYWQTPHAFSATKFQGRKLYKWAREGIIIPKAAVKRHIAELEIIEFRPPHVVFRATVSSGTYIRKLFEEMAMKLGTIGHLTTLTREAIGVVRAPERELEISKVDWKSLLPIPFFQFEKELSLQLLNGRKMPVPAAIKSEANGEGPTLFGYEDAEGRLLGLVGADYVEDSVRIKVNLWDAKSFQAQHIQGELVANKID